MIFDVRNVAMAKQKAGRPSEPLMFRNMRDSVMDLPAIDLVTDPMSTAAEDALDLQAVIKAAEDQARRETLAAATEAYEGQIRIERASISRSVQQFEQEKQNYFADLEQEVVKLSLAIAERVLRRESSMDPMLLAGAARVALEQLADGSEAVLRVSAEEVNHWNEAVLPSAKGVVIEADADLPRGECVLKTRSGTVQLGLRAQLQEIERGFFELMGRRPAAIGAC